MLHAKLLLRRLACVRWLLAAGLVLGWSGKAAFGATVADARVVLSVSPSVIGEDAGSTDVVVTGTLDGQALDEDVVVLLATDDTSTAQRDLDYTAVISSLMIPAGSVSGTTTITITPRNDKRAGDDKTIRLRGVSAQGTVGTVDITLQDAGGSSTPFFAADAVIDDQIYVVGAAIALRVLPEALGGTGDLTYGVSALPAGLAFDAATRMLSGTPAAATNGAVTIVYTVTDEGGTTDTLTFSITIVVFVDDVKIVLSVDPAALSEDAGPTAVVVTGTLDGQALDEDVVVLLITDDTSTAVRDLDYTAVMSSLMIPAGSVSGTTTITITPINDERAEGDETIRLRGVYAQETVGTVDITLQDDEGSASVGDGVSASGGAAQILLTVDPVALSEDAGPTAVVVTGTLDGQVFDDDVVVLLTIDLDPQDTDTNGSVVDVAEATRAVDYIVVLSPLVIPPGSVSGTTTVTIIPINDKRAEGDEIIRLRLRSHANNQITVQDAQGDAVKVTIVPVDITLQDPGEGSASFFATDAAIDDYTYTAGTAIADLVLPEASGGTGELTYGVSSLPSGLSFDAATRTLSGTPTAATHGAVTIVYTATDEGGTTDTLTFTIAVHLALVDNFDSFLDLSSGETGATVLEEPEKSEESEELEDLSLAFADNAAIADQTYTAEWPVAGLVLPAALGGTGELTYSVSALPAGLSFDAATRTISGTPSEATDGALTVVYTVVDEEGNTAALTFTITVNEGLTFGDFFDLFGAGKVVPTVSHE